MMRAWRFSSLAIFDQKASERSMMIPVKAGNRLRHGFEGVSFHDRTQRRREMSATPMKASRTFDSKA